MVPLLQTPLALAGDSRNFGRGPSLRIGFLLCHQLAELTKGSVFEPHLRVSPGVSTDFPQGVPGKHPPRTWCVASAG